VSPRGRKQRAGGDNVEKIQKALDKVAKLKSDEKDEKAPKFGIEPTGVLNVDGPRSRMRAGRVRYRSSCNEIEQS